MEVAKYLPGLYWTLKTLDGLYFSLEQTDYRLLVFKLAERFTPEHAFSLKINTSNVSSMADLHLAIEGIGLQNYTVCGFIDAEEQKRYIFNELFP